MLILHYPLQLEKAVKLSQIDIGNEGAAFVEVLVGRSSGSESDFQVSLINISLSVIQYETFDTLNSITLQLIHKD